MKELADKHTMIGTTEIMELTKIKQSKLHVLWRTGFSDFPTPVKRTGKILFNRYEVMTWLSTNDIHELTIPFTFYKKNHKQIRPKPAKVEYTMPLSVRFLAGHFDNKERKKGTGKILYTQKVDERNDAEKTHSGLVVKYFVG